MRRLVLPKSKRWYRCCFAAAQSTLLHFLGRLSVKTHRFEGKTVNDKHPYVLPESVLAFLLDTTREAAKACKKYAKNDDAGFAESETSASVCLPCVRFPRLSLHRMFRIRLGS